MNALRDTRTAGQRRADEYNWGKPRRQHARRAPEPERDTSRILAQLAVLAWLAFLIGCCLLAWFWTSSAVQSFLLALRGLS